MGFLDKMCTHILDFQDRKLKTFKGVKGQCLAQFVEKYPEKKAYFELTNETMKFTFPEPGPLEGVKSRSKVVLRMSNVTFTYPSKDKTYHPGHQPDMFANEQGGCHWCKWCGED